MFWYRVDVEIFLLGKESEVVKADNSNTADISSTKLNYQT